jgi:hypothetical protein
MKALFLAMVGVIVFMSCQKFTENLDELEAPNQEWLLPVAKSTINFDDIREITDIDLVLNINPNDLDLETNVVIDIPSITNRNLGAYPLPLPEIIHEVHFDSLSFTIELTNPFPFTISAGTELVYRNSQNTTSDSNVLLRWPLSQPLFAGQSTSLQQTVGKNFVQEAIYVYIENFSTPGANNQILTNTPLLIKTSFKLIDISKIELNEGHTLTSIDTVGIVIDLQDENQYSDDSSGGIATLYFDNTLPVNQRFQAYFLRNEQVVDSLLVSPAFIDPSLNSPGGDALNIVSSQSVATISWDRLNNLSSCDKLVIHHFISTQNNPNNPIVANETTSLQVQLVVDLKINFSIFRL